MRFAIRPIRENDREWVRQFVIDEWGADSVVVHEVVYYPHRLKGYVAESEKGERVGLATYVAQNSDCEIVSLNSVHEGEGIGTALVNALAIEVVRSGCTRLWCMTTNDNHPALGFYQKRGFRIVAVHAGAVDRARALKPSIPLLGIDSIPIRDEIELELLLQ